MFRTNKYERPGQIKTPALAKGLLTAFVALSLVSTVGAAGKGKGKGKPQGPRNTGEITIEVNPVTCDVYVQSEKDISNVIYNGVKEEYLYDDGVASPIGNTYKIGTYADLLGVTEDVIYVKAGNNGRRGVGAPYAIEFEVVSACEGIAWGTCPCQETGQPWADLIDAAETGDIDLGEIYIRDDLEYDPTDLTEYTYRQYRPDSSGIIQFSAIYSLRGPFDDGEVGCEFQTTEEQPPNNIDSRTISVGNTQAQSIQAVRDCRAGLEALSNTQ